VSIYNLSCFKQLDQNYIAFNHFWRVSTSRQPQKHCWTKEQTTTRPPQPARPRKTIDKCQIRPLCFIFRRSLSDTHFCHRPIDTENNQPTDWQLLASVRGLIQLCVAEIFTKRFYLLGSLVIFVESFGSVAAARPVLRRERHVHRIFWGGGGLRANTDCSVLTSFKILKNKMFITDRYNLVRGISKA
jgi:hypothetical protein